MTEEYPITTHPDGKQFIRIEDKWMPLDLDFDSSRVEAAARVLSEKMGGPNYGSDDWGVYAGLARIVLCASDCADSKSMDMEKSMRGFARSPLTRPLGESPDHAS